MNTIKFPRWNELPEINLYMDQIMIYLQNQLDQIYFFDEKFITRPMINNYVKTGIVRPPEKKQYDRYHIAYFLVVTILKRCYSMQQVSTLIQIHSHMKDSSVPQAYDIFIDRFESSLNNVFIENINHDLFNTRNEEQELMDNVIQCIVYKIHSEYLLSQQIKEPES